LQTTLLGLALALIAAILAAFAAPFFIDWSEWRPQLEAQASALAGSRVTISGKIDLTLLPTPAFVLRNVSLGDAETGTGMRAAEMRGSLSLTALLSGKIEADEFIVSRPAIRLVIQPDGKLLLPAGASAGQEISVGGFVFEAGSLTIEDRRNKSLFLAEDFSARGELVSREGPFRLDGGFRMNGARWILRASSGRFGPDHSGKVRFALERPSDAVSFEAEGVLALANAAPRFEGKITAAQQSGALPWRVSADAAGDVSEIRFGNLELALGKGELPITLSGEGKLSPRAGGALEVSLNSKRIDLDLGDPKAATAGAAHVLPLLGGARELLSALPFLAQIAISADGILAGGQLVRDIRARLRSDNNAVALELLEAKLPGRAAISLSAKSIRDTFTGPIAFESDEPQIFARWLLGEELSKNLSFKREMRLNGTLGFARDEVSLGNIQALVENTKLSGSLSLRGWNSGQRMLLADIETEKADFDSILPVAKSIAAGEFMFSLNLLASNATLLNTPLRRASIAIARLADGIEIKNLTIEDFSGFNLSAKGTKGEFEYSVEIAHPGGIGKVLEYFSGSADFAAIATRYAASHFPLRIAGKLTPIKTGWRLGGKSNDALFVLDLNEMRGNSRPMEAAFRLPETEIFAKGELRFGENQRFEPSLALTLKSDDLRKAIVLADRASAVVLPANGSATLARNGNNLVLEKLSFELAGTRGQGRVSFPAGELSPFSGQISLDRASAGALLSLALGRSHVSYVELGVPLLANFPGRLKMEIGSLSVSERISLQQASLNIRSGRFETVFEDFQAQLAGGKISGSLRVADTFPRVLEIKLDAADVALPHLLAAKTVRGVLGASLVLSANGNTQDALLASLAGQGTIALSNFELDQSDATAIGTVYAATAKTAAEDQKIEQTLLAALERAPLKVSKLEAPLVIANGIFRSGSARAVSGSIEITLSGSLNVPKQTVEALLNIETKGETSLRPGATIRWQGPLEAPERKVDARALITAITLRALERGQRLPSNTNLPQEERDTQPAAKKKRPPTKQDVEAAPLLPPPASIPAVPQPRSQN
jgi:hypothetical protein